MSYTLLPEWSLQDGVLLTWPHAATDWGDRLDEAEQLYVRLALAITRSERLLVACHNHAVRRHVQHLLEAADISSDRYRLAIAPCNDTWARDHGPLTVADGEHLRLLDFRFNGWGGKYPHVLDDRITGELTAAGCFGATPRVTVDLVLEGGGIETDGRGSLLTTASCLLAPTRNPTLARTQLEQQLKSLLGMERVLWLHHGHLQGDDTDGHIDTLARFCDAHTIAYVQCTDSSDAHFSALAEMERELQQLRDADGVPYRLVPLPWPQPKVDADGRRLPATYANFLIINGAVLVPTYDDPADERALAVLQTCFPERRVIGIDCTALIRQNGSLHCVTMQLPAGVWGETPAAPAL